MGGRRLVKSGFIWLFGCFRGGASDPETFGRGFPRSDGERSIRVLRTQKLSLQRSVSSDGQGPVEAVLLWDVGVGPLASPSENVVGSRFLRRGEAGAGLKGAAVGSSCLVAWEAKLAKAT